MKINRLYEDKEIILEKFEDGKYRITFFNEENHWAGDLTFNKDGIINNDL